MRYKVLMRNRFGEAPEIGDIIELDAIAARVPLQEGVIQPATVLSVKKSEAKAEAPTEAPAEFICPTCEKVAKSKAGLKAHMRSHG